MKLRDTLLLVGGSDSDRPFLCSLFQNDYHLLEANGIEQGLFLLEQNQSCIAAVIVDLPPPQSNENSFLAQAHRRNLVEDIPILAITSTSSSGQLEELAFSLGATDVILRSAPPAIFRRRLQNLVKFSRGRRELLSVLKDQTDAIRRSNEVIVDALSSIIEYRSVESGSHILRIRGFTELLLKEVARSCPEYALTPEDISIISSAAALHDIGKISIPDHILNKPGKLTEEEMAVMRTHTTNGTKMLETLRDALPPEYLQYAHDICRFHHERWNGTGYPDGLSGDQIPLCAQVVAIADVFDALVSDRVYKKAIPPVVAVNSILNGDCGLFSPTLLTCFMHVSSQFIELAEKYSSGHSPKEDVVHLPTLSPALSQDIGSLQMTQAKYQALLHYTGATVVEIDLDSNLFHIVYNPFPHFQPILNFFPLEQALNTAALNNVHPADVDRALQEYRFLTGDFFAQGLRKYSFSHRIFFPLVQEFRSFRVTALRLNVDKAQRKAILIWQPADPLLPSSQRQGSQLSLQDRKASYALASNVICRRHDRQFSFLSGGGKLMDLLGYNSIEVRQLFHDHFLEMILPEDQEAFRTHVDNTLHSGDRVESEYRMRHKDGHILWVLEHGYMISDDDGNEYFYGSLVDNSRSHELQAELMETIQRNQLIIDQSDDIIFDWDFARDQVQVSSNWKTLLGYEPTAILRSDMLPFSRIHPDDFPVISALGTTARQGNQSQGEGELRIANRENQYLWFRLRLTSVNGSDGVPCRAVGTLTNIDSIKRSYLALQSQVQQDPLTGLLNKAAIQSSIRTYLESPPADGCALLMIDLDNFKSINDRFGHLFGDTVLTRTAHAIRHLFRGNDLIGRVGGDEFMVLMKDVRNESLVLDRCETLLNELDHLFQQEKQTLDMSCSIGIALSPEHGASFQALFQHADQALYRSKQSGKHCFTVYGDEMDLSPQAFTPISTPIDSNEQPGLSNDSLVRAVIHLLTQAKDPEVGIQNALALVGQSTDVSRIYIFENNDVNTHCSNTFEWCNEGIPPEIDNLQDLSYETDIPGWEDNYDENGILFCTDITRLSPGHRAILEPQGIKSMLHCGIYENGVFRGYIGLDECSINRIWTKEQIELLIFLSEVLTSFLLKTRAQGKAEAMSANLSNLLATRTGWTYVIDPSTYRLRYVSERARQVTPGASPGSICYQTLIGRDTPCESCPMAQLNGSASATSQVFLPRLQVAVAAEAIMTEWNDRPACLVTCQVPARE